MKYLGFLCIFALVASCGPSTPPATSWSVHEGAGGQTSYGSNSTVVVTPGKTGSAAYVVTGDTSGGCVTVAGSCVDLSGARGNYCSSANAQADVVMVNGKVTDVICYPPKDSGTVISTVKRDANGNAQVPQTQNGQVVTFDKSTNGKPIKGDVTIDAERTTLFGNGVDKTTLQGNVKVNSNNSRIRGVTVTGNIDYSANANGSALAFCKVHGDLNVASNDTTVVDCQVFGDVNVSGNGAHLTNVGVGGRWNVTGKGPVCNGCYSFADKNQDFVVQKSEQKGPVDCAKSK